MSQLYKDAIFWIETEKIVPNPYQPRKEFDQSSLEDLADSVRQYGVLQPLVVTRTEKFKPEGGMNVEYELIAGERRLRAAKIAGLFQVPVIVRTGDDNKMKLELAIIENLQREDLSPVDRAKAFLRLAEEFEMTHAQIGKKMGKSREYVSNTLRLLSLPQEIMDALAQRAITEGHTRPLLMLSDRPEEQHTLFKNILTQKMSVRESERVARGIAKDKVRSSKDIRDPRLSTIAETLSERLGTKVSIEQNKDGGKIVIDFFSPDELDQVIQMIESTRYKQDISPEPHEEESPDDFQEDFSI